MGVLCIAIIMVMRVLQSCYTKKASSLIPNEGIGYIKYVAMSNFFSAGFSVITLIILRNFSGFRGETFLISTLSGLSLAASSLLGLMALKRGTIVLNSIFGTAGLIVPCVAGIFMFDEPMTMLQVVSICILLFSAYLLINSSKQIYNKFSIQDMLVLIGVFLANGLTMFFQKVFTYRIPDGNVSVFSFLTFFVPAVILSIALPFMKISKSKCNKKENKDSDNLIPRELVMYSSILAFAVFVINQLATMATAFVPSAVLFTFINGGATIIAAIVGAIMFKERLTAKSICGIILGVCSLICINGF